MFELEYDKEADAAYIRLREGKFVRNERPSNSVVLDLGENGELLGIEVLNVHALGGFSPLLDISATAGYLNTSESTLRRWVKDGAIPTYKLGKTYRFKKEDVDVFIEASRVGG